MSSTATTETGPPGAAAAPTWWTGTIAFLKGKQAFSVAITHGPDGPRAVFDSPRQKLRLVVGTEVVVTAEELAFSVTRPDAPGKKPARIAVTIGEDRKRATGTLTLRDRRFVVDMRRVARADYERATRDRRPQAPKPPFPYRSEEVVITTPGPDPARLVGTLLLPNGPGPFPLAILIPEGGRDRDGSHHGHKPLHVLGDHLARAGLASFRADSRGAGGSGGRTANATLERRASDVVAIVAKLVARPGFDRGRVAVVGRGYAGLVAAMSAGRSELITGAILIGTPGVPGAELAPLAREAALRARELPAAVVAARVDAQRALTRAIADRRPRKEQRALLAASLALDRPDASAGVRAQLAAAIMVRLASPRSMSALRSNPPALVAAVRSPVLIIGGAFDREVPVEPNIAALKAALAAGGNNRVEAVVFPRLNHLLQPATTGLPDEYEGIDVTIAPTALTHVERWLEALKGSGR